MTDPGSAGAVLVTDAVVTALTARPRPRCTIGPGTRLIGVLSRLPLRARDRPLTQATGLSEIRLADG